MTDKINEWHDWKPVWTFPSKRKKAFAGNSGKDRETSPHMLQENKEPTAAVQTRMSATRKTETHRRRITDARLWQAMSPFQQNAALAVEQAFRLMSRGLGYRISAPDKPRTGSPYPADCGSARDGEKIALYFQWAERCKTEKLNHAAAVDILIYGKSCRAVDRVRHMRNGSARRNLLACLDVYCTLRGWPKG
ncbi:MAG: hypothetical protein EA357_08895 [Micavibrio sp.]|nr:MAG: hypothetical protein EA357_08895 [Micavibrio sp.]